MIEWTSDNEEIATVENGVVTFNQAGVFGDVTITASCPATGNSSSIKLNLAAGLIRELFHKEDNVTWSADPSHCSSEWGYGTFTLISKATSGKRRLDFMAQNVYFHAGNYPFLALRLQYAGDMENVSGKSFKLDASGGTCNGQSFSGELGGGSEKWDQTWKCSDGSRIVIYDLSTQAWKGFVLPATDVAKVNKLTFKYADIVLKQETGEQLRSAIYWIQTFKTLEEVATYIQSEGLTYEVVE